MEFETGGRSHGASLANATLLPAQDVICRKIITGRAVH